MKACVLTFAARSGTGTQTVTGVTDKNGVDFEGKLFLFQSGYAAINTLTSPGFPANYYMDARGVAYGAIGSGGSGSSSVYADTDAGFKDVGGGSGDGYCLIDYTAQPSFGGLIKRAAYVSAIAAGSFTLTYDQNDRTGDDILVTVLGGDDLTVDYLNTIANGTYSVSGRPVGVLVPAMNFLGTSLTTATATGGGSVGWGWDTRDGNRGANVLGVSLLGGNFSRQVTDRMATRTAFGDPVASAPIVSAWGDLSLTIGSNSPLLDNPAFALGGTTVRAVAGTITQPLVTGSQTFDTGIDVRWIMFASTGYPTSTDIPTLDGMTAIGWATPTAQVGWWTGENGDGTFVGARYLSDSTVLRFATADGGSTDFHSIASVTGVSASGPVVLDWTAVDGTEREILWFAIGHDAALVPVAPSEPCCCSCDDGSGSGGGTDGGLGSGTTGPILPPIDPTSWTPSCSGGGTVPSAADATDSESWIS